ncbi:MAG: hybrid sensory histidine kinase BarA [Methanomassiliicoccales archaeon PtaB.Bin134]|jgi:CheY-like chemotaxis protein|nr:MAG: hybrid sensory histidine kinase BarA [Methanomassiliicoccales archaeon PtaB.Bin134]
MRPTRILYIEDNDQNFYLVEYILKAKGYSVTRARDGREGLEMAQTLKPDMILLDIQLPVMDGYTIARELRRLPETEKTPMVALTSYAMPGDREKALASGCDGYIEKPIKPSTFSEQIAAYVGPGME